ncbi:MAG: hypothetical protein ABEI74_04840 [Candidatus Pacearchaeota archaeon]
MQRENKIKLIRKAYDLGFIILTFLTIFLPIYFAINADWLWIFSIFPAGAILFIIVRITEYYLPDELRNKEPSKKKRIETSAVRNIPQ